MDEETFSTGFVATAGAETFSGSGEASVGVVAGALARVSVEAGETAWDTGASDKGSREAAPPSSAANFKEMLWYTGVTGFSRDCGGKRIQRAATTSHTMAVRIRATVRASDSGDCFLCPPFSCRATILVPSVNSPPKTHFSAKDQRVARWFRWSPEHPPPAEWGTAPVARILYRRLKAPDAIPPRLPPCR